jgi:hypothetical protein
VSRRVAELHPHPSFTRHNLTVPICELSAATRDGVGIRQPIVITQNGTILDEYAQWELARLQGRETLPCIEYELSDEEALQWLLRSHRRSNGLNDFARILLALDLEPFWQEKARLNKQAGGQKKGSSNLTTAHRLDVRSEIASAAGVSTGNVTKVKQLLLTAHSEILQALRLDEISIHRAWLWCKDLPLKQSDELRRFQGEHGVKKTIRQLVSKHRSENPAPSLDLNELVRSLGSLDGAEPAPIMVAVIEAPGVGIFVTAELFRLLKSQQELAFQCATNNR